MEKHGERSLVEGQCLVGKCIRLILVGLLVVAVKAGIGFDFYNYKLRAFQAMFVTNDIHIKVSTGD